jgi:hypothetical protein
MSKLGTAARQSPSVGRQMIQAQTGEDGASSGAQASWESLSPDHDAPSISAPSAEY